MTLPVERRAIDNGCMKVKLSQIMEREMNNLSLSVTALARKTAIPRTTIHDWLNGRLPSSRNLHYLSKLSDFFNISLNELLFGTLDKNKQVEVLFSSSFTDGKNRYKIIVEKFETK